MGVGEQITYVFRRNIKIEDIWHTIIQYLFCCCCWTAYYREFWSQNYGPHLETSGSAAAGQNKVRKGFPIKPVLDVPRMMKPFCNHSFVRESWVSNALTFYLERVGKSSLLGSCCEKDFMSTGLTISKTGTFLFDKSFTNIFKHYLEKK